MTVERALRLVSGAFVILSVLLGIYVNANFLSGSGPDSAAHASRRRRKSAGPLGRWAKSRNLS